MLIVLTICSLSPVIRRAAESGRAVPQLRLALLLRCRPAIVMLRAFCWG